MDFKLWILTSVARFLDLRDTSPFSGAPRPVPGNHGTGRKSSDFS